MLPTATTFGRCGIPISWSTPTFPAWGSASRSRSSAGGTTGSTTAPSSRPFAYFGPDGVVRDYTDESAADPYLKWLVRSYNQAAFRWENIPFYMTTNLKVTKKLFREKVMAAMFITQMFNYMPSYKIDGVRVRPPCIPLFRNGS